MRLLHTTEPRFEEFLQDPAEPGFPKYAILSHRWGPGELTNEELEFLLLEEHDRGRVLTPRLLKTESKNNGQGHIKVMQFREFAASNGYQWVWIDTVCIDKSSSAELSEAVNSMWNWYNWSDCCFAYLADVAHDDRQHGKDILLQSYDDRHHILPECTYCVSAFQQKFTMHERGWTMQELISPKSVVFLDKSWQVLVAKSEYVEELASITGIDKYCLSESRSSSNYTAAQLFAWAAGRKTTRIEDEAYCLLGLFAINIPLLYGEGRKAFQRLCEAILLESEDQTIFAHSRNGELFPENTSDFRPPHKNDPETPRYYPILDSCLVQLPQAPEFKSPDRLHISIVGRQVRFQSARCVKFNVPGTPAQQIVLVLLFEFHSIVRALTCERSAEGDEYWYPTSWRELSQLMVQLGGKWGKKMHQFGAKSETLADIFVSRNVSDVRYRQNRQMQRIAKPQKLWSWRNATWQL